MAMNLIAKEYVAAQDAEVRGSYPVELAGAAVELEAALPP